MTTENLPVLGILAVAVVLFVSEKLRVDVSGHDRPGNPGDEEAFSGFASPAAIIMWAGPHKKQKRWNKNGTPILASAGSDSHRLDKSPIKYQAELCRALLERVGIRIE